MASASCAGNMIKGGIMRNVLFFAILCLFLLVFASESNSALLPPYFETVHKVSVNQEGSRAKSISTAKLKFCYSADKADCEQTKQLFFVINFETKDEYRPEGEYPLVFDVQVGHSPKIVLGGNHSKLIYIYYHAGANSKLLDVYRLDDDEDLRVKKLTRKSLYSNSDFFKITNEKEIVTRFTDLSDDGWETYEKVYRLKNGAFESVTLKKIVKK